MISKHIEQFVVDIHALTKDGETSFLEAVVEYCDKNDIEMETAATIIKDVPYLQSLIEEDARKVNYIK